MLYPFQFEPRFKERVWGGRNLERLFGKNLPAEVPIGESWEVTDREGDESVIANGPHAGKTLRWLMENHAGEVLGPGFPNGSRFPLLVKILDAQEKLSLQVHPPEEKASALGGESKTEMWYVVDAAPEADLYAGLKSGVTREVFEAGLKDGTVAECFHRIQVQKGDALFLPSGRVHAIGAGNVIFEIQQNSDTTYRVFDWNRVGLDGKPRTLHVKEALESINFNDFEPRLIRSEFSRNPTLKTKYMVESSCFSVNLFHVKRGERFYLRLGGAQIIGIIEGRLRIGHPNGEIVLKPGDFGLLPVVLERVTFTAEARTMLLQAQPQTILAAGIS